MDRDESIKRFKQGNDAWNEWAQECLDERKKLEETGQWDAKTDILGRLKGQNQATIEWITKANVDFRNRNKKLKRPQINFT